MDVVQLKVLHLVFNPFLLSLLGGRLHLDGGVVFGLGVEEIIVEIPVLEGDFEVGGSHKQSMEILDCEETVVEA